MIPLRRLTLALLAAFAFTALVLSYWSVVRADALLARDDNPRRVLTEQQIRRGQILDRHEVPLVTVEQDGQMIRRYLYPEAAPVVGYYSLRYGVGGVEAAYDDVLRGIAGLDERERLAIRVLHRPQVGGDVRLTLDLEVQRAAEAALDGRSGAVVVIGVPSGEILAMASSPTFDPNRLDETWDDLSEDPSAPLLNRATQGLYQPGAGIQTVLLAEALNLEVASSGDRLTGERLSAEVDGQILRCGEAPDGAVRSLADAYRLACPAPFIGLAERIGSKSLHAAFGDFGLLDAPQLQLPAAAVALDAPPSHADLQDLAIGQGDLLVSPLQMAQVATAIANKGTIPPLRLVSATREPGGYWIPVPPSGHTRAAIRPDTATAVAGAMAEAVRHGAAARAAIEGQTVYGHAGLAIASAENAVNAWFIGFVRNGDDAYAVAVLLEDTSDAGLAAEVGGLALQAALEQDEKAPPS
jgi:peptidoglycan glycosyltransferase